MENLFHLHINWMNISSMVHLGDFRISSQILKHKKPSIQQKNNCILSGSSIVEEDRSILEWL